MSTAKARSKVRLVRSENKGVDQINAILRAKTAEKRHRINMKRNSKMCNLVSSVQISGFPVHQGTQEAKDGIVYSAPGWDIAYQRI
jgi:hypothetical protein